MCQDKEHSVLRDIGSQKDYKLPYVEHAICFQIIKLTQHEGLHVQQPRICTPSKL